MNKDLERFADGVAFAFGCMVEVLDASGLPRELFLDAFRKVADFGNEDESKAVEMLMLNKLIAGLSPADEPRPK